MRRRMPFLVFVICTAFVFNIGKAAAVERIRTIFLQERVRFYELSGGKDLESERRTEVKKLFGRSHDRMLAALLRLENIRARLEGRSAKMGARREEVKQAGVKIARAGQVLNDVRRALKKAPGNFENIFASTHAGVQFHAFQYDIGENILSKLLEAHTTLVEATLILEGNYEKTP